MCNVQERAVVHAGVVRESTPEDLGIPIAQCQSFVSTARDSSKKGNGVEGIFLYQVSRWESK